MTRKLLTSVVSAALLSLGAAATAQAQTSATVVIHSGPNQYHGASPVLVQYGPPPPPRHEAVPAPRRGYVWVPGYWDLRGKRHVWVKGHWEKARPGYRYREPRWEQRDGRWHMRSGGWDRDGDGVPNRYDSQPNNPNRR